MKFKNFLNFLSGCICKIIWQFSIFKTIQYILIEEGSLIKWILEVWIELEIFQDSHSGHFTNYLFIYWYVQNSKIKLIVSERISTAIPTINWKVHLPKSNIWRGKWVQKLCNHYIMSKKIVFSKITFDTYRSEKKSFISGFCLNIFFPNYQSFSHWDTQYMYFYIPFSFQKRAKKL